MPRTKKRGPGRPALGDNARTIPVVAISAGTESDVSDAEGARDYDVTLTIGERTVEGGITLWPDKINGGMAPCDAPEDGWISTEIVRELHAMPDSLARKVRRALAALSEGEVE